MRVLLHSRSFHPNVGGLEKVTGLLASELARTGVYVTLATDTPAPGSVDEGFPFDIVRGISWDGLARLAARHDVVHACGHSVVTALAAARARKPLVITHHGYQAVCLEGNGWHGTAGRCEYSLRECATRTLENRGAAFALRQLLRYPAGRAACHLARANVAVSRFVAEKIRAPRSLVIHNAQELDPERRVEPSPDHGPLLFVGRLVTEKGVPVLLEAVAIAARGGARVELEVVGSGPEEERLRRMASELDIARQVRFAGTLSGKNLDDAFGRSLAVLMPSRCDESFGMVAAEAMARGRLPLVSNLGALPEVVEGLEGVTIRAEGAAEWARRMRRVVDDGVWRRALEVKGGKLAARFSVAEMGRKYREVYEWAIEGRDTPNLV